MSHLKVKKIVTLCNVPNIKPMTDLWQFCFEPFPDLAVFVCDVICAFQLILFHV